MEKETAKALSIAGFTLVMLLILSMVCFYFWQRIDNFWGNCYRGTVTNTIVRGPGDIRDVLKYDRNGNGSDTSPYLSLSIIAIVNVFISLLARFVNTAKKEIPYNGNIFKYVHISIWVVFACQTLLSFVELVYGIKFRKVLPLITFLPLILWGLSIIWTFITLVRTSKNSFVSRPD